MKLCFYSVFDSAVGAYMRPFVMQSDGQAVRQFTDEAVGADNPIASHPEDYSLFRVGMFDDNSGTIIAEEPTCLARAHEVVAASRTIEPGKLVDFDTAVGGTG